MSRDYTALVAAIEVRSAQGFGWRRGQDCLSFSAACIEAQTGEDILAGVPHWKTRREALAIADQMGGLSWGLDQKRLPIPPAMAQRGDIAGLPDRLFGIRLMVVEGDTLVGPGARGLERLPRSAMTVAWSATEGHADG